MIRPRKRILRMAGTLALFVLPATLAHAQGYGYGPGYGYPGYGPGYPAIGYGYPGIGYGYPGFGYNSAYGFGYPGFSQYITPGFGYPNPLFGLGLSPLGVESALVEGALMGGRTRSLGGGYGTGPTYEVRLRVIPAPPASQPAR